VTTVNLTTTVTARQWAEANVGYYRQVAAEKGEEAERARQRLVRAETVMVLHLAIDAAVLLAWWVLG